MRRIVETRRLLLDFDERVPERVERLVFKDHSDTLNLAGAAGNPWQFHGQARRGTRGANAGLMWPAARVASQDWEVVARDSERLELRIRSQSRRGDSYRLEPPIETRYTFHAGSSFYDVERTIRFSAAPDSGDFQVYVACLDLARGFHRVRFRNTAGRAVVMHSCALGCRVTAWDCRWVQSLGDGVALTLMNARANGDGIHLVIVDDPVPPSSWAGPMLPVQAYHHDRTFRFRVHLSTDPADPAALDSLYADFAGDAAQAPVVTPRRAPARLVAEKVDLARALWEQGQNSRAGYWARWAYTQIAQWGDADSLEWARAVALYAESLFREEFGTDTVLMAMVEQALDIQERHLGPGHPEVATTLVWLGRHAQRGRQPARANAACARALAIRERALSPDHPEVLEARYHLARTVQALGDRERARGMFDAVIADQERVLGPDHRRVAVSLANLAGVLAEMGREAEAVASFERALAIYRRVDPEHINAGEIHNRLGQLRLALDDYPRAAAEADSCVAIYLKRFTADVWWVAWRKIGNVLLRAGDYQGARTYLERFYSHWSMPVENAVQAEASAEMGRWLAAIGDITRARALLEDAARTYGKVLGPEAPDALACVRDLAVVLRDLGDLAAARERLEFVEAAQRVQVPPDPLGLASTRDALASVHLRRGDRTAARRLLQEVLAVRERHWGANHSEAAATLLSLARIDLDEGRLDEARARAARAAAIQQRVLGAEHPERARSLELLAAAAAQGGALDSAMVLERQALAIQIVQLGAVHPEAVRTQERIARLLQRRGDTAGAWEQALAAESAGREHLRLTLRALPERDALGYAASRAGGMDVALALVSAMGERDPEAPARTWDALIRSRAVVLEEMAARHRSVRGSTAEVRMLSTAYVAARQRFANLAVRGSESPEYSSRHARMLEAARKEMITAERALAERNAEFRVDEERAQTGLKEVKAALPPGVSLVGYARYLDDREPTQVSSRYGAFVLDSNVKRPRWVDLGDAAEIDARVRRWRAAMSPDGAARGLAAWEREGMRAGDALRRAIWDPLQIVAAERAFVVPDGMLHLVSLAALPVGGSSYLAETGPLIHYLSAERDLTTPAPAGEQASLLVMGGPSFDDREALAAHPPPRRAAHDPDPGLMAAAAAAPAPASASGFRGTSPAGEDFRALRFAALDGASAEVDAVVGWWNGMAGALREGSRVTRLVGAEATEAAFKLEAPRHHVVHLATHGFFLGSGAATGAVGTRGIGGVRTRPGKTSSPAAPTAAPVARAHEANPLLLSGLALAGANQRATARPEEEDGILTAEEIAAMDLSGVRWAVLSACETGTGEVRTGEGVFGLRRAFQIAGADVTIMSLWSVEDAATREWMEALYRNRLAEGLDTAAAVRAASRAALASRRAAGQSTHPFYWGGFVAVGDWR